MRLQNPKQKAEIRRVYALHCQPRVLCASQGEQAAGTALRDLLEAFRDQVALQRERFADGTALQ